MKMSKEKLYPQNREGGDMPELEHLSVRVAAEKKDALRKQAAAANITMSEVLNGILERFEPLPEAVESAIVTFSKGLGISVNDVISCAVLSMVARWDVEQSLYGGPLLNPLIVEVGPEGWSGVHDFYVKQYRDKLFEDAASMKAHNTYLENTRWDLAKRIKNFPKRKARARAAREARAKAKAKAEREQDNG
jgi:hypothetical protein